MNRNPLFCHKCGAEIRPGREYCESCGTSAREASIAAHKRMGMNPGVIQTPQMVQNQQYINQGTYQQVPVYDNSSAELSRKIDILQSNQTIMMQNMENMLKKYAKKRTTCIAVLSIFLGIFILACIILTFVLIFMTSDTVKTIINIIDELHSLLINYEGQLNSLMDIIRGLI